MITRRSFLGGLIAVPTSQILTPLLGIVSPAEVEEEIQLASSTVRRIVRQYTAAVHSQLPINPGQIGLAIVHAPIRMQARRWIASENHPFEVLAVNRAETPIDGLSIPSQLLHPLSYGTQLSWGLLTPEVEFIAAIRNCSTVPRATYGVLVSESFEAGKLDISRGKLI